MTIWLVGVSDCESNSIVCACLNKEIAVREMFNVRDRLIAGWLESISYAIGEPETYRKSVEDLYKPMIEALKSDDYENWDNYPHDRPYISEIEILET